MHRSCKISGLADALTERGIVSPSPIQQLVMPKLAQGCLASERCIGLYYRYIMWYVYGASMFFSVTIMRKKKRSIVIAWGCFRHPFFYPTQMDHGDGKLYYSYEIDIYIYIIYISKYRLTKLATFRMAQPFPPRSRR